jgi:uncharacterized protein with von Willebrand factor type A (vWA) domain
LFKSKVFCFFFSKKKSFLPSMSLPANLAAFCRLLRRAGLPVAPAETLAALDALTHIDIASRDQFAAALRATLIHRADHRPLFDQAFAWFWRADPPHAPHPTLPALPAPGDRRLAEARGDLSHTIAKQAETPPTPAGGASAHAPFRQRDFETLSAAEISAARRAIDALHLAQDRRRTRRHRAARNGAAVDLSATLQHALRNGGEILDFATTAPRLRPTPIVVLCDISGSMAGYTPLLLHFLHALVNRRGHTTAFLFGTRLTNITRTLRHRDPEHALASVGASITDFAGGTRIADAINDFNRTWGRRVLAQGATLLLFTDGLDRPDPAENQAALAEAMARLHRTTTRLIWLNPLLRWHGFTPRAASMRAMLPHVDELRPAHSLHSLESLVALLNAPTSDRQTRIQRYPHPTS